MPLVLSELDSRVDDLLDGGFEYSEVLPSSEAFGSFWYWPKLWPYLYLADLRPGYMGLRAMLEFFKLLIQKKRNLANKKKIKTIFVIFLP